MVYLSHCGTQHLPGSFNKWYAPFAARDSRVPIGWVGGHGKRARAALIGQRRPEGNFREYLHSRVPLSGIRQQRGLWLPLRAAQQHTLSSLLPGWVVGYAWGRGTTDPRVVRMRIREG